MSLIINTFKATEESQPFSHPLRTNGFLNRKQIKSPIKVQIMRVFLKIMSVLLAAPDSQAGNTVQLYSQSTVQPICTTSIDFKVYLMVKF